MNEKELIKYLESNLKELEHLDRKANNLLKISSALFLLLGILIFSLLPEQRSLSALLFFPLGSAVLYSLTFLTKTKRSDYL